MMKTTEYLAHDAVGLAQLVAKGAITAPELAQVSIGIIEALNPLLNAVICKDYERALKDAQQKKTGPLAGVPFLLKDVYLESEGMPTTYGSKYLKGRASKPDSVLVSRWRQAGLTILGKTNAPEFAADFVTEPAAYGKTINPWNAQLTVGGSSGGAACAVSSGMVPIAHATDLGGSIRIPSACCGLYGFKPTSGLNTVAPYFREIAHGLNSDHVLTRTVRDSAASLDITVDPATSNTNYLDGHLMGPGKLRIVATVHAADGTLAGPRQVSAVEATITMLRENGHDVVLLDRSPLVPVGGWFDLLWIDDIHSLLSERRLDLGYEPRTQDLEPLTWLSLKTLKEHGPDGLAEALRAREETKRAHLELFNRYDILLTPSLATDPAKIGTIGFLDHDSVQSWAEAGYGFAPFFILANVAGQPAASLPFPDTKGDVPVGIQIMAAPHRDLLILQLSRQLEQLFDWQSAYRRHWEAMGKHLPLPF